MEEPEATADQKFNSDQFSEISLRNKKPFLLFDQINIKFGAEIFQLNDCCLKFATLFELEKIKEYLKKIDEIEKLEEKLYVISKSFVYFFLEKNTKKMSQNQYQEIYNSIIII